MATLLEMNQAATRDRIAVMQAWLEGKRIVVWDRSKGHATRQEIRYPSWNWAEFDYEVEDAG